MSETLTRIVKKMADVATITRLAGAEYSGFWEINESGEIIALKGFNIGNNKLNLKNTERISRDLSNKLKRSKLSKGDIVFPCVGSIGNAALISEDNKFHINQNIAKITCNNELVPEFLVQVLISDMTKNQIIKYNTSSSQPNVLVGNLRKFEVPVFPLKEQQKIASILSKVDEQIEQTERIIEKTELLKKGLMQKLLTKGIGHTKFKKTELGEIPEEWNVFKMEELTKKIFVGIATSTTNYYTDKTGIPIIRNQNIKENQIDKTDLLYITNDFAEKNKSKSLKKNDIISVRTGYPGLSAVVTKDYENCHTFTTLISRPKESEIDSFYLCYFINSPIGKKAIKDNLVGSAQQNLNVSSFKNVKIFVPNTIEEQQKIASILSKVDSQLLDNHNYLSKLEEIKKGLMQDLLTGKVRVCV